MILTGLFFLILWYFNAKCLLITYLFRCESIKSKLSFNEKPLFAEENDFTLAYGILAHKNSAQVPIKFKILAHTNQIYLSQISVH